MSTGIDKTRPIIIVKKKAGHGGHHGGAWKVAYADFVTAMMALFIVLWLLNTSKPVREAIAGYFKDPSGTANQTGSSQSGTGENLTVTKDNVNELKDKLEQALQRMPDFDKLKQQVEMTVTSEGLRIELLETASGTFFDLGSPYPNEQGRELLITLAQQLGEVPNKISLEGHTDSKPFAGNGDYGNWELSADRANAARRIMQKNGLRADQVSQVRGFADQRLRLPDDPENPSNRRISIIVHYLENPAGEEKPGEAEKGQEKPEAGKEAGEKQKPSPAEGGEKY
ncbi:MAG TPA: flagellar motor protein MotB [Terriglobales bacterium]|nr:flagellar motor protein MotB [Terriglobales bacterium]